MSGTRKASEVRDMMFPYYRQDVCFFEAYPDGTLSQLHTKTEKREAAERMAQGKCKIYAVWPGQWRSDLFEIDDLLAYLDNI